MKHRNGFVSNSSSTSFIVAFKTKPTSSEEVFEMIKDSKYASKAIAEEIFHQIDYTYEGEILINDIVKDMHNMPFMEFIKKYQDEMSYNHVLENCMYHDSELMEFILAHKDCYMVEIGFCDENEPRGSIHLQTMGVIDCLGLDLYQTQER